MEWGDSNGNAGVKSGTQNERHKIMHNVYIWTSETPSDRAWIPTQVVSVAAALGRWDARGNTRLRLAAYSGILCDYIFELLRRCFEETKGFARNTCIGKVWRARSVRSTNGSAN